MYGLNGSCLGWPGFICVRVRVEIFDRNTNMGRVRVAHFNLPTRTLLTHQPDTIDSPTKHAKEIQKLVESLHLSGVEFKTINSVESGRRGITVVVSGSVKSDCFTGCRKFVETFFLAPHEKKGYLVINDIFHFVSEKELSGI
ncbi:putative Ras GTPase-activating protein-binding protein [Helianthus anomalus]